VGIPPPPGPQPSGRLELDLDESTSTLLAHEDGSCEWLDSSDPELRSNMGRSLVIHVRSFAGL